MTPRFQSGAMIAALAVVGVLAVAGWARKPAPESAVAAPYYASAAYPTMAPQQYSPDGAQPQYANAVPCVPALQQVAYTMPAYANGYAVRTVRQRPVVQEQQPAPVYETRTYAKRGRSTKKSVAIVAGSAGVGAAIGGIAGGGKGAGIGALAGGAGGFIYDRLTHNR